MDKFTQKTNDGTALNIAALKNLFPEVVSEGKVDFDALKTILGGEVSGDERYQFTWAGKRAAMLEASTPITKTLRPCVAESKDWETTKNIFIEGDNLDALKILQNTYGGKVKMIYIDPPYNTGHDFIYHDNFHGTRAAEDIKEGLVDDETGERLKVSFKQNTESNGYFHSDWCSMMYPRLKLARNLLTDDGVIFISIDDNEVMNLRRLCDEIFGENNFVANFLWKKKGTTSNVEGAEVSSVTDATLCYKRSGKAYIQPRIKSKDDRVYPCSDAEGNYRLTVIEKKDAGDYKRDSMKFEIIGHGPRPGKRWQLGLEKARALESKKRFVFDGEKVQLKIYDFEDRDTTSAWPNLFEDCGSSDSAARHVNQSLMGVAGVFDTPKPVELMSRFLTMIGGKDSVILDFFSGSATTAHAVMQLNAEDGGNRKFIMVQLPEVCADDSEAAKAGYKNICEIGKERIRRAGEKIKAEHPLTTQKLDVGFRVFKVDSSNLEDVFFRPADYQQDHLLEMINNVKTGRTGLDLLFGCLLEWGLPIDLPTKARTDLGTEVYDVGEGRILACFNMNVTEAVLRAIAAETPDFAIFRDLSFTSSADKINVAEIFKTLSPNTKVKVL